MRGREKRSRRLRELPLCSSRSQSQAQQGPRTNTARSSVQIRVSRPRTLTISNPRLAFDHDQNNDTGFDPQRIDHAPRAHIPSRLLNRAERRPATNRPKQIVTSITISRPSELGCCRRRSLKQCLVVGGGPPPCESASGIEVSVATAPSEPRRRFTPTPPARPPARRPLAVAAGLSSQHTWAAKTVPLVPREIHHASSLVGSSRLRNSQDDEHALPWVATIGGAPTSRGRRP